MKRFTTILLLITLCLLAVACSPEAETTDATDAASTTVELTRLNQDYGDASSIQTQLSVGTLQLEASDLALSEAQAAEILPLWQALLALGQSDTVADAEIVAVVNQIQDTMQPEQIAFISALQLTDDSIQEMVTNGELALGRQGGRPGGDGDGEGAGGEGGGPGGGAGGRGAGGGGGVLGGGPGGAGGGGGADLANLSDEERAALRAERFGEGAGLVESAASGAVVRALSIKAGVEQAGRANNPTARIINEVIAEALGISGDDLRVQIQEGIVYADLIANSDIDIDDLRSKLDAALAESIAEQENRDAAIDRVLGAE